MVQILSMLFNLALSPAGRLLKVILPLPFHTAVPQPTLLPMLGRPSDVPTPQSSIYTRHSYSHPPLLPLYYSLYRTRIRAGFFLVNSSHQVLCILALSYYNKHGEHKERRESQGSSYYHHVPAMGEACYICRCILGYLLVPEQYQCQLDDLDIGMVANV